MLIVMENRTLYFGDNLEILREKMPDGSFDLIYLDPPFNSDKNYNVIFKEGLQDSPAQVHAFEDSWHWTRDAQDTFEELTGIRPSKTKINEQITSLMFALEKLIGHNDMLAYLTMMTIRLIELRRVLKPSGSIYLHCDPTASHYLKIVMDTVFGKQSFRNEIIWHYRRFSRRSGNGFPSMHDVILFYAKSDNNEYHPLVDEVRSRERYEKGWHTVVDKGVKKLLVYNEEKVKAAGIDLSKYDKVSVVDVSNTTISDVWEIPIINPVSRERLGYPTQKPEALLEMIIKASSKEGDWVLDPFCGCGTTVSVAERLKRNWVGVDITMLAINLIRRRIEKQFGDRKVEILVDGLPKDIQAAQALFKKDPFQFEYWALDLVNAVPAQSKTKENMRGADKGVDGVINFVKDIKNGQSVYGKLLVQVKGGAVHRDQIATLKGDVERERADGGLFITLEEPTKPMREEAVSAGSYKVSFGKGDYPKIQILTIGELLNGKKPEIPATMLSYHKEATAVKAEDRTKKLL